MKRVLSVFLVFLFAAGVVYAKGYEVAKKAGVYDVVATIDKNPPVVGDNNMTISVKEAGRPVADAKVRVDYSMPGMPGMPAMNYKADAKPEGGVYKATMNLSMAGSWNVAVKITKAGKTSTMKFSVDAR